MPVTTVKAMNKLQDFVSAVYKGVGNTGQLTSVLRNNEHRTTFDKCEDFLWVCFLAYIVCHSVV